MICFRDMTFCDADCANWHCFRNFTPERKAEARQWWNHDPDNAPIAFSDFSNDCLDYQPKEE